MEMGKPYREHEPGEMDLRHDCMVPEERKKTQRQTLKKMGGRVQGGSREELDKTGHQQNEVEKSDRTYKLKGK